MPAEQRGSARGAIRAIHRFAIARTGLLVTAAVSAVHRLPLFPAPSYRRTATRSSSSTSTHHLLIGYRKLPPTL